MRLSFICVLLTALCWSTGVQAACRLCTPLQCLNNLRQSASEEIRKCAQAADRDIAKVLGCLTGPLRDAARGVDKCGNCIPNDCSTTDRGLDSGYARLCGGSIAGTVWEPGPNKCAQLKTSVQPGNGDRVLGNYVYHCDQKSALDTCQNCNLDCRNCDACRVNCATDVKQLIPETNTISDAKVWSEKSRFLLVDNRTNLPIETRDLWEDDLTGRDLFSRQNVRPSDYRRDVRPGCRRNNLAAMLGAVDAQNRRVDNIRLARPAISALDAENPPIPWQCDHVFEIWMLSAFFQTDAGRPYEDIRLQITARDGGNFRCEGQRVVDILNDDINVIGVDQTVNLAKYAALRRTVTRTRLASVYGAYRFLMDDGIQSRYFATAEALGRHFERISRPGEGNNIHNEFMAFASDRYTAGLSKLYDRLNGQAGTLIDAEYRLLTLPQEFDAQVNGPFAFVRHPEFAAVDGGRMLDPRRWLDQRVIDQFRLFDIAFNDHHEQNNIVVQGDDSDEDAYSK